MSDRTDPVQTSTITTTPIPMPGQLRVEFYSSLAKERVTALLSEVKADVQISALGTVTRVRHLDPGRFGRVTLVLTGDDGQSALVSMGPDAVRLVHPLLAEGTQVVVYGTAVPASGCLPASIDGYNAQPAPVTSAELLEAPDDRFWAHGDAWASTPASNRPTVSAESTTVRSAVAL